MRKSYLSEYFLQKLGRCTKLSNSQTVLISGNVINQILYLEIPESNSRHVENVVPPVQVPRKFGPSAAVLVYIPTEGSAYADPTVFDFIEETIADSKGKDDFINRTAKLSDILDNDDDLVFLNVNTRMHLQ